LRLRSLVRFLDETLDIRSFRQDKSLNGLQVEGRAEVRTVALAVDACGESISRAVRRRADLLLVHHGLFWGETAPVTGILARRLGRLLGAGCSLYAAHLPLDCHPSLGNNARLAASLGIARTERFGEYAGVEIGLCGELPRPAGLKSLAAGVRRRLGGPVRSLPFGPRLVRRLGIVSGAGASLAQAAAEAGCDALLTGETSHSSYHTARECGVSLVFAGHYATETAGVLALGELIAGRFGLRTFFIDLPTGY